MFKPTSKKVGGPRYNGSPRNGPKPRSVEWYKQNLPERFNNTKIAVRNTSGFTEEDCEIVAARVLAWNESPQPHINDYLLKENEKLFNKELLHSRYFTEQNDLEPPKDF